MKSLKSRIAMAAAILAATGVVSANAADEQQQTVSQAAFADSTRVAQSSPSRTAKPESAQFEWFENQMQRMSAPSYSPSEHPDAKPAPKSSLRSVFDDPANTSSLG